MWDGDTLKAIVIVLGLLMFGRWLASDNHKEAR